MSIKHVKVIVIIYHVYRGTGTITNMSNIDNIAFRSNQKPVNCFYESHVLNY